MVKIRRSICCIISAILIVLLVSPLTRAEAAEAISISEEEMTISVGEYFVLELNNTNENVKWKTSDALVADVNKKTGIVLGLNPGVCDISTTLNGVKYVCTVTVEERTFSDNAILAGPGTLNKNLAIIKKGETVQLSLSGATEKKWATDDKKCATVKKGLVTGVEVGFAEISVTDKKGYKYSCFVIVLPEEIIEFKYHDKSLGDYEEIKHPEDIGYNILYSNGDIHYSAQLNFDKTPQFVSEWSKSGKELSIMFYSNGKMTSYCNYAKKGKEIYFYYSDGKLKSVSINAIDFESKNDRQVHCEKSISLTEEGLLNSVYSGMDKNESCGYQLDFEDGNLKQYSIFVTGTYETIFTITPTGMYYKDVCTLDGVGFLQEIHYEDGKYRVYEYDQKTRETLREAYYNADGTLIAEGNDVCYEMNGDEIVGVVEGIYDEATKRLIAYTVEYLNGDTRYCEIDENNNVIYMRYTHADGSVDIVISTPGTGEVEEEQYYDASGELIEHIVKSINEDGEIVYIDILQK